MRPRSGRAAVERDLIRAARPDARHREPWLRRLLIPLSVALNAERLPPVAALGANACSMKYSLENSVTTGTPAIID